MPRTTNAKYVKTAVHGACFSLDIVSICGAMCIANVRLHYFHPKKLFVTNYFIQVWYFNNKCDIMYIVFKF